MCHVIRELQDICNVADYQLFCYAMTLHGKMTPATVAGRADYFGLAVNRAARLREAALPGQARSEHMIPSCRFIESLHQQHVWYCMTSRLLCLAETCLWSCNCRSYQYRCMPCLSL